MYRSAPFAEQFLEPTMKYSRAVLLKAAHNKSKNYMLHASQCESTPPDGYSQQSMLCFFLDNCSVQKEKDKAVTLIIID